MSPAAALPHTASGSAVGVGQVFLSWALMLKFGFVEIREMFVFARRTTRSKIGAKKNSNISLDKRTSRLFFLLVQNSDNGARKNALLGDLVVTYLVAFFGMSKNRQTKNKHVCVSVQIQIAMLTDHCQIER
jgi:hypothetical protein